MYTEKVGVGQGGITTAVCGLCNEYFTRSIDNTRNTCQKCADRFALKDTNTIGATNGASFSTADREIQNDLLKGNDIFKGTN